MAIVQTPQSWIKHIAIIGVVATLAACGGGGGGGNSNSDNANGGGSGSVTPPPVKLDVTPDNFVFEAKNDAMPGETYTSNAITVSGINAAVPVSITGGEYAIDNGDFTAAAATISAGQTIVIKATAAPTLDSIVDVELTIGGVKGTYSIITPVDETPPTAEFMFPPPVSMTDGDSILVRGVTSDDYSEIEAVTVNGIEVESIDNFATWQVRVPLTSGDNKLVVETADAAGNPSTNAAEVMVRRGAITEPFPDEDNQFSDLVDFVIDRFGGRNRLLTISGSDSVVTSVDLTTGQREVAFNFSPSYTAAGLWGVALDEDSGQLFFRDRSANILTVSFMGGVHKIKENWTDLGSEGVLILDKTEEEPKLITVNYGRGNLVAVDLELTSFNVFSSSNDSPYSLKYPHGVAQDNDRYLITSMGNTTIFAVDRETGMRSIFSDNSQNTNNLFTEFPGGAVTGITIDKEKNRALVVEAITGKIFAINLDTGNRTVISDSSMPAISIEIGEAYGIGMNSTSSYAFVASRDLKGIIAIDLVTGHRVVFSKSVTTP